MPLITPTEVNTIAFVKALDPALILPAFISSAETKYIVPIVTQVLIDEITATPGDYTTLVDEYIKPYLAFAVKYMFYNQLLIETGVYPSTEAQSLALQEILEIMEVSRDLLETYLTDENLRTPSSSSRTLISGFLIR